MTPEQVLSIVIVTSVTRLVVTLGLAAYARLSRTYPGFTWWVAGNAVGGLGVLALTLRALDLGPNGLVASAFLANSLIPLSLLLLLDGTLRFVQGQALDRRWYALCLVPPLVSLSFLFGVDLVLARMLWSSVYIACGYLAIAYTWLERRAGRTRSVYRALALLYASYAAVLLTRGVAWALGPPVQGLLYGGTSEGILYLAAAALDLATQVMFLLANSQRLQADLRAANAEIQRMLEELQESTARDALLSGILPICPKCRTIRDEAGNWLKLEAYVSHRTEAEFSHGLCPDCTRRLYPGLAEAILDGK